VDTLVIGLPLNMDGSKGFQAERVCRYAEQLRQRLVEMDLAVEVVYWDERLTTSQAEEALISSGRGRRARRGKIDAAAAAVILQSYLDR
jgi:putative Holliday junction resolvase